MILLLQSNPELEEPGAWLGWLWIWLSDPFFFSDPLSAPLLLRAFMHDISAPITQPGRGCWQELVLVCLDTILQGKPCLVWAAPVSRTSGVLCLLSGTPC